MEKIDIKNLVSWSKKISLLQSKVGQLEADGVNNFSKWKFISSNQLKQHLNNLMPEVGLICLPEVLDFSEETIKTKKGESIRSTVTMSFEIIDIESGYGRVLKFVGIDSDGAKSFQQSVTDCFKRFFFNLLCISERGEDGDNSSTFVTGSEYKKESLKNTSSKLLNAFVKCGVSKSSLEERVKKDFKNFDSKDIEELREYYAEIKK